MRFPSIIIPVLSSALLLSACLESAGEDVVEIPSAENIRRTEGGRIFVAGGDAVHEVVRDGGGYATKVFLAEQCSYTAGLAQLRDWMFSVCVNLKPDLADGALSLAVGKLYARSLTDGRVVVVAELNDFALPNGLDAIATDDVILIADEDFTRSHGGVARAKVDFSRGVPTLAKLQTRWIGAAQNVTSSNGVRVIGRDVFLTDIDTLKRVPLDEHGEPGAAQVLYTATTVLDDLVPYCDGLLVADFLRGVLVYTTLDGKKTVESKARFATPSALLPDGAPLFETGKLLVTLSTGNRLVQVTPAEIGLPDCEP
jgi:hypothetical protein